MRAKTGIALAAMLAIYVSSPAMAESVVLNDDAPLMVSQDVAARASLLTPVAWRTSPRSTHSRLRQSRNAGLRTGESTPLSSDPNWPADNYQYWHQACCM
jgi:hypothetical protein